MSNSKYIDPMNPETLTKDVPAESLALAPTADPVSRVKAGRRKSPSFKTHCKPWRARAGLAKSARASQSAQTHQGSACTSARLKHTSIREGLWVRVELRANVGPRGRMAWLRRLQCFLTPFGLAVILRGRLLMIWSLRQALEISQRELVLKWIREQAEFRALRVRLGRPQRWR
jgi:hypothetical protein